MQNMLLSRKQNTDWWLGLSLYTVRSFSHTSSANQPYGGMPCVSRGRVMGCVMQMDEKHGDGIDRPCEDWCLPLSGSQGYFHQCGKPNAAGAAAQARADAEADGSVSGSDQGESEAVDDGGHGNGSADDSGNEYEREGLVSDGHESDGSNPPFDSPAMEEAFKKKAEDQKRGMERAPTQPIAQRQVTNLRALSDVFAVNGSRNGSRASGLRHSRVGAGARSRSPQRQRIRGAVARVGDRERDGVRGVAHGAVRGGRQTGAKDGGRSEPQHAAAVGAAAAGDGGGGDDDWLPDAGLIALAAVEEAAKGRGRSYVFTVNLPLELDQDEAVARGEALETAFEAKKAADRIDSYCFQLEKGADGGRYHLQGWLYMKNACEFKGVHKLFPDGWQAWVKKARGTPQQCWDYCTKEETKVWGPWTKGERPSGAGKRNDIEDFVKDAKLLKTGEKKVKDLQEDHKRIEARCMRYFDRVVAREGQKRHTLTKCILLHGPPATGKTTRAAQMAALAFPGEEPYYLPIKECKEQTQWWDNYNGEKAVIIEDAEPEFMNRNYFLRLIDKVPMQVAQKGNFKNFTGEAVYITSNYSLEGLFPYHNDAIKRRVHEVWETSYHPHHKLNAAASNSDDCASNAIFTKIK